MTRYGGKPPYPFTEGDNMTGQCALCGEVFYGEKAFSLHQTLRHGCIDPATPPPGRDGTPQPWRLDSRGRWHYGEPMSDEQKARARARRKG